MYGNTDWNKQICAGDLKKSSDACNGDSGGPLYFLVQEQAFLVGIISYASSCGGKMYFNFYPFKIKLE